MEALSDEYQRLAMNAICNAAENAGTSIQYAVSRYERPSAIYRPRLSIDGDQWCALYGDNIQDGVAGFGKSPNEAVCDFDRVWDAVLPVARTERGGK